MTFQLVAVLEHRQRQRDDTDVQHATEDVARAWPPQSLHAVPELQVARLRRVCLQAIVQGFVSAEGEEPDAEDGEDRGDEDRVQDALVSCRQGEGGEVGEHVQGQLGGHLVACGVVDGDAEEEEEGAVGEGV